MKSLVPDHGSVLIAHLEKNEVIQAILARVEELGLPDWYLGAGRIPQTVWNALHGFSRTDHIRDYDIPYFDAADTSYEAENRRIRQAEILFAGLPVTIELQNQARVHLWYEEHFGYPIEPYKSVEDAIGSWPTTASAIGICGTPGDLAVYAPFGLSDLVGMVASPNKRQITREIYMRKISRWRRCWPQARRPGLGDRSTDGVSREASNLLADGSFSGNKVARWLAQRFSYSGGPSRYVAGRSFTP